MGSHVRVAQAGEIKRITDHQHRHMKKKLAEDDENIAQVDWGATRKEHQGHHQVQEVEEDGPEDIEAGKLPSWALLTPLMLELLVRHALSLTLLAFTNLLD